MISSVVSSLSLLLISLLPLSVPAHTSDRKETPPPAATGKSADNDAIEKDRQYDLALRQLELDRLKYQLEVQKAQDEKSKTVWTAASIVLSFAIGAGTLLFGILTQNRQARLEFEMKAAEIVMDAKGPRGALTKAQILSSLFPKRLPPNFAESMDKEHFKGSSAESKRELLKLLAEKSSPAQIVQYWQQLFPGDDWPKHLVITDSGTDSSGEK
jgi:hypothetical protein